MIQIIAGEKGKGKTKILIAKVNEEVQTTKGNVVYLDKNIKHMYELSNKIRLINVNDFLIVNSDEFLGFICGIISQDNDLEKVYLDSFLSISSIKDNNMEDVFNKLNQISEQFSVDFIISISVNKNHIPENYVNNIIEAL